MAGILIPLTCIYACAVIVSGAPGTPCQDIDSNACALMAQQQDVCSNHDLALSACPRYCNLCPLECYNCNGAVKDYHLCNTTSLCGEGQMCMKKELSSVFDGHHEYELTCEDKQVCDGFNIQFGFGRRSVHARDLTVSCCAKDRCNYPEMTTTAAPTTTAATKPAQTTSSSTCNVDLIFVVDETGSMARYESEVSQFLHDVVARLPVSADGVHVSLGTFASSSHEKFDLNAYTSQTDVLHAVDNLRLAGHGTGDTNAGLSYAVNTAMTPAAGDRPGSKNVVVILTDDGVSSSSQLRNLEHEIHAKSEVIAVLIGFTNYAHLASDSGHQFHLNGHRQLTSVSDDVARLVCSSSTQHTAGWHTAYP